MSDNKFEKLTEIRRRRLLQGLGGAGVASLAGCIDSLTGGSADGGGKLKQAQVKSPVEFDPVVLNDVPSGEITDQVFEGLYDYDEGTGHVPVLATGEPTVENDGTRYTVEIEDGATFQNGDDVTAEDVKHSFLAPREEETENANEVTMIDSITAVDDKTVQFDLKYPYGPFMHTLHRSIVPKSVREEDKEAFNTQEPVGSGPFEFIDWTEGEFVTLERYDDYWGEEQPNISEIEFVPIEEATTRVTTLRNGDNDVIKEIPPDLWGEVEDMDNAAIQDVPGIGYFYLAFNCKEGPTTDPKVREAVDYTFSMDQAVSNFVEPTGLRQYSPLPKSLAEGWEMPLDEWQGIPHDKDIDEATALFEEAGMSMDYDWRIIVPPDDKREQIGVTVGNGLQEAGFENVEVQRLDWGAFLDQYITGSEDDYNMYTLGWAGTPDPDAFTYFLLSRADDTLGVTNGTFWGDNSEAGKQASDKFIKARESADEEERQQLYQEGITTALEERAHLPSYNLKNSWGVRNYVSDYAAHPVTPGFKLFTDYNNVSVDKESEE